MKKFWLLIAVLLCFPFTITAYGEEYTMKYKKSFYEKVINAEYAYIKSLVLPNGAVGYGFPAVDSSFNVSSLPTVDGIEPEEYTIWKCTRVVPYFSAFAVLGVMETDKEDAQDIALGYINWYTSHMNTKESDVNGVAGTVYDYYVFVSPDEKQTVEVTYMDIYGDKSRNYDSTDSYASTFIQILCAYTEKYDSTFLDDKKDLLDTLTSVINATYCTKPSLTGAKPDYMVCYLMDNCEVYGAYRDLAKLFPEYKAEADKFRDAINSSLSADGYYYPAVFENGKAAYEITDINNFEYYPHATSQLFPITFGIVDGDSDTAKRQYELFNSLYGQKGVSGRDWTAVDCGDAYPWALNLRAAVIMKDYERAERYVRDVYTRFIMTGHTSNYYCAEAGHILIALTQLCKDAYDDEDASQTVSDVVSDTSTPVTANKDNSALKKALPFIALGVLAAVGVVAAVLIIKNKKK